MTAEASESSHAEYVEFLRELPLLHDLPPDELARLAAGSAVVVLDRGQVLMREGTPGDGLYLILSGELEVTRREGGRDVILGIRTRGELLGERSLLEQGPRSASVTARTPARLLRIAPADFRDLLARSSNASITIIRTLTGRLRSTEALLMQREKLAALGTLSAGLAHELNNPAAAIRSTVAALRNETLRWRERMLRLLAQPLSEAGRSVLAEIAASAAAPETTPQLSPLERAEAEDELTDVLAVDGVPDAADVASTFVERGVTRDRIEALRAGVGMDAWPDAVAWLAAGLATDGLLDEVARGAASIGAVVDAVKTYSYMDRAPLQTVDVRKGLEDTLRILAHKLKQGVTVQRRFAEDVPVVEALGAELNQVWTNLIDNAIDAMGGRGTIEIEAHASGDSVVVDIIDSGPGIAPEHLNRIFHPFFTTKGPGAGSGLGLHIAHTIVVGGHGGSIDVESKSGRTRFRVTVPKRLPESTRR